MTQDRRYTVALFALFGLAYLGAVLPLAFFRHDDWWILGNSVEHFPKGWSYLFKPSLYIGGREVTWFFRPGFKLGVYVFYQLFGFHYQMWMGVLLALYLSTVALGYCVVTRLTSTSNGLWFVAALLACLPIHFGSLAWMGEGMMNVPQAFLLMVCTYTFVRGEKNAIWMATSWSCFALALCFKESSIFHTAFLAGLVCAEPLFQKITWKRRAVLLTPFALIAGAYLVMRFGWMPISQSYRPEYTMGKLLRSAVLTVGPVLLPWVIWSAYLRVTQRKAFGQYLATVQPRLWYLPFLGVSVLVYLGHDFFSPGWLLVVGTFTVLGLSLAPLPSLSSRSIARYAAVLFVLSALPVGLKLKSVAWWRWHESQRDVYRLIAQAPANTRKVMVRICENPDFPRVDFDRVVANEEGLRQIWFLTHGTIIPAQLWYCGAPFPEKEGVFALDWRFPDPTRIVTP